MTIALRLCRYPALHTHTRCWFPPSGSVGPLRKFTSQFRKSRLAGAHELASGVFARLLWESGKCVTTFDMCWRGIGSKLSLLERRTCRLMQSVGNCYAGVREFTSADTIVYTIVYTTAPATQRRT